VQDVVQVAARTRQAVHFRHHNGIAGKQCLQQLGKLRPAIGGLARRLLAEDPLADNIKARTESGWPDNVRDLNPAILSALISARKFGLWVPNEHVYQLPDASFLCEYLKSVGKLLEDRYFDEANSEALSWKPFLDNVKLT